MKTKILTLILALIAISSFAQMNLVTISGYVTNSTGAAVPNHEIYIYADSSQFQPMFNYYNQVYTNANGYYIDTISFANQGVFYTQGGFIVGTAYCNGSLINTTVSFNTNSYFMQANFSICDSLPNNGCNAYYSFSVDSIDQHTLYFYNTSTGVSDNASYLWNFNDGTSSTDQNPVHTFLANGPYNICFSIYGDSCQSSYCSEITIETDTIITGCNAFFQYQYITNDSIVFENYYNTPAVLCFWDFGDSSSSSLTNPTHHYTVPGTYNVCLTVTCSNGTTTLYCQNITIENPSGCNASYYTYPDSTNTLTYHFYNTSTVTNPLSTYTWFFSDGTTSTDVNPVHTFLNNGIYSICLRISDSLNNILCSYCDSLFVGTTDSSSCQAYFYAYPDSIGGQFAYYFSNYSTGNPTNLYWSFGDGTYSQLHNLSHIYSSSGTYTVCLTIWDSTSLCQSTYCNEITVSPSDTTMCNAYFDYLYSNYPDSVLFYGYSSANNPSDSVVSWTWSFGDGTSSTGQNPIHFFTPGLYEVCIAITTASGCSSTYCENVHVYYNDSTTCGLYVTANSIINESSTGAADGAINIDVIGGTPPYTFNWSNGAVTQNISGLTQGYYDVSVTDNSGLQGCETWATFEILNESDSTNWNYNDTLNTLPFDTCFNFQPYNAYIYSYTYDATDNTISLTWIIFDLQGVSHGFITLTYSVNSSGYYLVLLSIECNKSSYNFYDQIYIATQSSGINTFNVSGGNINLFPNPVSDILNISVNLPKPDQIMVNILDVTGQVIYTKKADYESGQKVLNINTSSLSKGMYFVQVNYNNGQKFTQKFIK